MPTNIVPIESWINTHIAAENGAIATKETFNDPIQWIADRTEFIAAKIPGLLATATKHRLIEASPIDFNDSGGTRWLAADRAGTWRQAASAANLSFRIPQLPSGSKISKIGVVVGCASAHPDWGARAGLPAVKPSVALYARDTTIGTDASFGAGPLLYGELIESAVSDPSVTFLDYSKIHVIEKTLTVPRLVDNNEILSVVMIGESGAGYTKGSLALYEAWIEVIR